MNLNDWNVPESFDLPDYYFSLMTPEDKVSAALDILEDVESRGLTPLAASVVGSRLNGTDTETSDTDLLVVVLDKMKNEAYTSQDMDYQVVSLESYLDKFGTSVPYLMFHLSPFRVTRKDYSHLFNALRYNYYRMNVHAQSYVHNNTFRANMEEQKRDRIMLTAWWLMTMNTALMPRWFTTTPMSQAPLCAQFWVDNARNHVEEEKRVRESSKR